LKLANGTVLLPVRAYYEKWLDEQDFEALATPFSTARIEE
jgi:hypothetical protein